MKNGTLWIQLGRLGDIINILPLLYSEYRRTNTKQILLVAKNYFQFLDGCSYIEPMVWEGDFADLQGALAGVRGKFSDLRITQIYANRMAFPRKTPSFLIESWNQVGRASEWGKLPLIIDRRNFVRERELVDRFIHAEKPTILVTASGISSPFRSGSELFRTMEQLHPSHHIVDLSKIQAVRFYDLLGLFDKAAAIITIDTGHMHLASASKVPVIALVTPGPTPWHTSSPRSGQILRMTYDEFESRKEEIITTIKSIPVEKLVDRKKPASVPRKSSNGRPLYHLYSQYQRTSDNHSRHVFARTTWVSEYKNSNWHESPVTMESLSRDSKTTLNDSRPMPYIKDMVEFAISTHNIPKDGIIVLTNDDICFSPNLGTWLQETTSTRAIWAHRWDFPKLTKQLDSKEIRIGCWCCGSDLFSFTTDWWRKNNHSFPDMLLGCEAWDWVMRETIRDSGGFELHAVIYHQYHNSYWNAGDKRYTNPGNRHNQLLAKKWLKERGRPLRELASI